MTFVEIHEFSTGIRPDINADKSWVSLGFTGQFMNKTIDPIPPAVERSIANDEFKAAKDAFSDEPAVIGRVVGSGDSAWSVVAMVTQGKDEYGRSASFYRYFLCEGEDNLSTILAWMQKEKGGVPVFNPSETKTVGDCGRFPSTQPNREFNRLPGSRHNTQSLPIILEPGQQETLAKINALAIEKANGQPVSWAFNVEALEQPWRFVVIQAASDRAYKLLQKAVANRPKVRIPIIVDEKALTSAIKSLIGSSTVKPEAVQTIVEALENKEITKEYWHSLFDSQGASNALSQKIYGSQMVRLLTLRTLAIPETLPEYLEWLEFQKNLNKRRLNQPIIKSLEFQDQLRTILINSSIESSQSFNILTELFKKLKAYQPSPSLLENLGDYCLKNLSNDKLARFYYQLSAYFEQGNKEKVSKKLFEKAFPQSKSSYREVLWGRNIFKKRPLIVQEEKDKMSVLIVILLVTLGIFGGFAGGFFVGKSYSSQPESNLNQEVEDLEPTPEGSQTLREAIKKIIQELQEELGLSKVAVIQDIKFIIGDTSLNYPGAIEGRYADKPDDYERVKKKWIQAIYLYQNRNTKLDHAGYILLDGGTSKALKNEVKATRQNQPSLSDAPEG